MAKQRRKVTEMEPTEMLPKKHGWHVDVPVKIERNPDGSITVRKA